MDLPILLSILIIRMQNKKILLLCYIPSKTQIRSCYSNFMNKLELRSGFLYYHIRIIRHYALQDRMNFIQRNPRIGTT